MVNKSNYQEVSVLCLDLKIYIYTFTKTTASKLLIKSIEIKQVLIQVKNKCNLIRLSRGV